MGRRRSTLALGAEALLCAGLATAGIGQAERLQWHFASGCAERGPAAVRALLREVLATESTWPPGLDAGRSLVATWQGERWHFAPSPAEPPHGAWFTVALWTDEGPAKAVGSCDAEGLEDWFLPLDGTSAAPVARFVEWLAPLDHGGPRAYQVANLVAQHLGPTLEGSPARRLLELAAECGDLCLVAWRAGEVLRVRGRSAGGLSVPAILLWRLDARPAAEASLRLHALAARDGERTAAARLGSNAQSFAPRLWQALLYADDATRLAAIDSLVRRGTAEALSSMVAAAEPDLPLSLLATTEAVRELWSRVPAPDRQVLLRALDQSTTPQLHGLAAELNAPTRPRLANTELDPGTRARWLLGLGCVAAGLYGLWLRARLARHGSPRRRRSNYLPSPLG